MMSWSQKHGTVVPHTLEALLIPGVIWSEKEKKKEEEEAMSMSFTVDF